MKRILLVTSFYAEHRGGLGIVAGQLAERLRRRGWQIIWAASEPAPPAKGEIRRLPMREWNIAERRWEIPVPLWGPVSLLRLCREAQRCDVIHLHDCLYLGNVVAYLCGRLFGKPVVITQHVGPVPYRRWWLRALQAVAYRTLGRLILGDCTACAFCSQRVQRVFSQFVPLRRKAHFIPNGVAADLFHPLSAKGRLQLRAQLGWMADTPVILFVGRFVEKKNLPLLRGLAGLFPACLWVFVGWGPDDPTRWRLPNVHCVGSVAHEDTVAYYQAADLLMLPSVGEGFPLAVQEAMACGTPALISEETASGMPGIETVALVSDLQWDNLIALFRQVVSSPAQLEERRSAVAVFARCHWDWGYCADQYHRLFAYVCAIR